MKKLLLHFLLIFAFILSFSAKVLANEFGITSINFDNSASFLSINSFDNHDFSFPEKPKLVDSPTEHKVYFDLPATFLKCQARDIVVSTTDIKEVIVKQVSTNPNVVRVTIYYNEGFNPKNIQLRKINNTLFVRFKQTQMQNYYFQQVYSDLLSSVNKLYENITMQTPVLSSDNSIVNQINSAFKLGSTTEDKNYILMKNDLVLPTKYYLDNINVKNGVAQVFGIGSITLTKPFILTSPTRLVYDIPNSVVNPSIRNKEIYFNQNDMIKAGQFDRDTVRIVITSQNAQKYLPVVSPDNQRIDFVDSTLNDVQVSSTSMASLNSVNDEIYDSKTHGIKLIFSKPVVYAIERTTSAFNLYLYNVNKSQDFNLKSSVIFANTTIQPMKKNGQKLSIPVSSSDIVDLHVGVDCKTLRIKVKSEKLNLPQKTVQEPIVVTPVVPVVKKETSTKGVIVIDAGHGGSDCGATREAIYEKNITLDISKRVENMLRKKGYDVYMTRVGDETVSLQERVDISENISPDVFVSIHVNSSNSSSPEGLETHYYKENSLQLAKIVHASMLNNISAKDRGLFKSKFYVINHTTAPAILVEIGFISNPAERVQIVSESRKQATAKAIAEGINDYFR